MKKFLFISILFILITNSVQSQNNVAIYATCTYPYSEYSRNSAETAMANEFNNLNQYNIIERNEEFLKKLQHELDYQYDGNIDPKQIAALGKQFGAQYVVVIQISGSSAYSHYAAKMINVETAQIVVSTGQCETEETVAKVLVGEIKFKDFNINKVVKKGPIRYVTDFIYEVLEQKDNNLTMITNKELLEYLKIKYDERFAYPVLTSYSVTKRPSSIRSQTLVRYKVNCLSLSYTMHYENYDAEVVFRASGNIVKCYDNENFRSSFDVLYYPSNLYEW